MHTRAHARSVSWVNVCSVMFYKMHSFAIIVSYPQTLFVNLLAGGRADCCGYRVCRRRAVSDCWGRSNSGAATDPRYCTAAGGCSQVLAQPPHHAQRHEASEHSCGQRRSDQAVRLWVCQGHEHKYHGLDLNQRNPALHGSGASKRAALRPHRRLVVTRLHPFWNSCRQPSFLYKQHLSACQPNCKRSCEVAYKYGSVAEGLLARSFN